MNCYICEKTPGASATHYHVKAAVGICHNCGIAVCLEHSRRDAKLGAPLLCPSCNQLLNAKQQEKNVLAEAVLTE